jgi:hypothetical protein
MPVTGIHPVKCNYATSCVYVLVIIRDIMYIEVISKFKKALKHSVQVVLDEKDSDECAI